MADPEYDKEQLRIMRNAFKAYDHDEVGTIAHSDVQAILEILGQKLDDKASKALIKEVDPKNTGKLDFRQFCVLAARFVEVEEDADAVAAELKEAFRVYDKEGKGYITVAILRDILHELDDKLTKNELDLIIEEIDADGSGTVDFDEFMQVMTGKNSYELFHNRRFTFHPELVLGSRCHCPAHRARLHRRIERLFENFLEQFSNPFQFSVRKRSPSPQTKTTNATTVLSKTKTSNKSVLTHGSSLSANTSSKKDSSVTEISTTNCCYRPIFRPRFPKWVPILTLYREIVQNPFRRRGRLMLTQF